MQSVIQLHSTSIYKTQAEGYNQDYQIQQENQTYQVQVVQQQQYHAPVQQKQYQAPVQQYQYQAPDSIQFLTQGLCTEEEARGIARMMWDMYGNQQNIDQNGLNKMMLDTYSFLKQVIQPSPQDLSEYQQIVVNQSGAGQVTLQDIEYQCINFLCQSQQQQYEAPKMSPKKQAWLDGKKKVAERCFKKYDEGKGYITRDQAGRLIADTYQQVGIQKVVTQQEVDAFMNTNDADGNGTVDLQEYTHSICLGLMQLAAELDIE